MDDDDDVPSLIEHRTLVGDLVPVGQEKRVPLTIICGFLGAGKSTLLKRILTERHGYRIAVIVNEFADTADIEGKSVSISSDSAAGATSEELLELPNGCLCCSIKDTGVAAIEQLMRRKGAFDYILLETTGLADPGPIAAMFWLNEEYSTPLGRDIALDGVVCVVDAVFGREQMQEDHATDDLSIGESLRQIAGSDVIILNKVDLASPESVAATENTIRQLNPTAPVYRTTRANVDLSHIVGISAYTSPPPVAATLDAHAVAQPHIHSDACEHGSSEKPLHYEVRGISSLQVLCPVLSQAQFDALDEWIRSVLWENTVPGPTGPAQMRVLRCKGAFSAQDGKRYVLQGVRSMYEISELVDGDAVGTPDNGKIVLIGKGLDDSVRRSLESLFRSTE